MSQNDYALFEPHFFEDQGAYTIIFPTKEGRSFILGENTEGIKELEHSITQLMNHLGFFRAVTYH